MERKLYFFSFFVLNGPVPGTPRHAYKTFRAKKMRRSDCVGQISRHKSSPKVDPTLKLSNYKATTQISHVFRTRSQMLTPFFRDWSWFFFTRILWAPVDPLTRGVFLSVFRGEFGIPQGPNIPKTSKRPNVWLKQERHRSVTGWQGHIERVSKVSG